MTSLHTPFFCVVKVKVAKVAWESCSIVAVSTFKHVGPINNWTSCKRKGAVSDLFAVYSPGRSKKKKAKIIMSAVATWQASFHAAARVAMCRNT
jgi:hypothetical protein